MANAVSSKTTFLASAIFWAAIFPQPAVSADYAQESKYVSVKIGPNDLEESGGLGETEFDTGLALLGAFGFGFNDISSYGRVRIEGEIGFRENDADSVNFGVISLPSNNDVDQTSVMANAYHDFLPGSKFRPYLGIGLGFVSSESADDGDSSTDLAYQAMIGLSYRLDTNWTLDGEYRYTSVNSDDDLENRALLFGVRYGF